MLSGRTLSDYKNFNHTNSGWHLETIQVMRKQFHKMKMLKHAKLGQLVFDKVTINEGLVFDQKNWELVGFTDINEDEIKKGEKSNTYQSKKLATHVLQFFFRSLFFKFDYPCAYFLMTNLTALQLNRLFWLGVSMLHTFEFEILVSCCDGASCNRSFVQMNIENENTSSCQNPFSEMRLFLYPILRILLRNQETIYTAVVSKKKTAVTLDPCFFMENIFYGTTSTQCILGNKEGICMLQIYKKAHVQIDWMSKMRVKIAVQTLSNKGGE